MVGDMAKKSQLVKAKKKKKKELAVPLAFCSSVGNRALAGTVYGTSGVQLPSRHTTGGWLESCWQGVNRCGPVCRVVFGLRLTGIDCFGAGFGLQWQCWITTAGSTPRQEEP